MLDLGAPTTIRLHPQDNVAIALADLQPGFTLPEGVTLAQPVPRGHKIALAPIAPGANVVRYGQIIGAATQPIAPGEHVHSHNLGMGAHDTDYAFSTDLRPLPPVEAPRTFDGFRRQDGQAGTRNYLGVLTSVNCSGSVARFIAEACEREPWLRDNPRLDGDPESPATGYAVFGQVVEGMDVVDKIRAIPVAPKGMHEHMPTKPILITKALIEPVKK